MSVLTPEQFQALLIKSRLVDTDKLRAAWAGMPADTRAESRKMANWLVRKRLLTEFQAHKLLKGARQGLTLGKYRILTPIGRGGMGTVYLARHEEGNLVAIKVLPPKRAKKEERTLARFLREMEMCQRVKHPNLARTFEVGSEHGIHFIAMEYIRGRSLKQVVVDEGPMKVDRAAGLFVEVAVGLAYAHARGLIHRDLKPSNIMVSPAGHAKILDFGLALDRDEEAPEDRSILGGKGYVVGTMDFIAPEQVTDSVQVDLRADLYALGCTMYYVLTGQPPFPGGTSKKKMKKHLTEIPEDIQELNTELPDGFARIVEKLMEKDPDRRYPHADAVCEALMPWSKDDAPLPMDTEISNTEIIEEVTHAKVPAWKEFGTTVAAPSDSESAPVPPSDSVSVVEPNVETRKLVWNQRAMLGLLALLSVLLLVILFMLLFRK